MKKFLYLALAFFFIISGLYVWQAVDGARTKLVYNGRIIHPFWIMQLAGYIGQKPQMIAIDIDSPYPTEPISRKYGYWSAERIEESYESYGYRYLGQMSNGVYVVEAGYDGGGTGFFMDLVFIQFI
ncbi:MAG: hypothetical protein HQL24_09930 [Candidatus Omnitrophica bacterium]|nr:hypothetical protein [Candidatus Omnitrophota bacterium]